MASFVDTMFDNIFLLRKSVKIFLRIMFQAHLSSIMSHLMLGLKTILN